MVTVKKSKNAFRKINILRKEHCRLKLLNRIVVWMNSFLTARSLMSVSLLLHRPERETVLKKKRDTLPKSHILYLVFSLRMGHLYLGNVSIELAFCIQSRLKLFWKTWLKDHNYSSQQTLGESTGLGKAEGRTMIMPWYTLILSQKVFNAQLFGGFLVRERLRVWLLLAVDQGNCLLMGCSQHSGSWRSEEECCS